MEGEGGGEGEGVGFDTWPKDYYHGYWDRIHALYNVSNLPRLLGQNTRPLQRTKLITATGTEHTYQTYNNYGDTATGTERIPEAR